jgi:hypothetical protein
MLKDSSSTLPGMRFSKLDLFTNDIGRMLEGQPYSARQIFQQISEQGFAGGYTIVKDYVRKVRPTRRKAYLKLAFAPGECAQVEWGSYGSISVGETMQDWWSLAAMSISGIVLTHHFVHLFYIAIGHLFTQ